MIVVSVLLYVLSDDVMKELSDVDVEVVIDEVFAMLDLTVEDVIVKFSVFLGLFLGVG